MIFGHDSLGINNHVFQSDNESTRETTYKGETIIQRFHDFQIEGGAIPKVRYSLTTTVFGTTYEKTITRTNLYMTATETQGIEDIETSKAEAEKFIDEFNASQTSDNSNGNESNGNGEGENGDENGEEEDTKETNWLLYGGIGLALILVLIR